MNTFTTLKTFFRKERICQKNEACKKKFREEETFWQKNYFQNLPFCFGVYCDVECRCEQEIETKTTVLNFYIS